MYCDKKVKDGHICIHTHTHTHTHTHIYIYIHILFIDSVVEDSYLSQSGLCDYFDK